jgi:hypothetical protein
MSNFKAGCLSRSQENGDSKKVGFFQGRSAFLQLAGFKIKYLLHGESKRALST